MFVVKKGFFLQYNHVENERERERWIEAENSLKRGMWNTK